MTNSNQVFVVYLQTQTAIRRSLVETIQPKKEKAIWAL